MIRPQFFLINEVSNYLSLSRWMTITFFCEVEICCSISDVSWLVSGSAANIVAGSPCIRGLQGEPERKAKRHKKMRITTKVRHNWEQKFRIHIMYALCRRDGNAIHVSRKNKNKKKDVNTNLGMMLPGTLVRENTRIKKILFWHIFIHKRGLYRISHHR